MTRGRAAEQVVQWACRRLEQEGRAWLDFTSPPTAGAPGQLRHVAGGLPDVMGVMAGGRAVVFDVKSTGNPAWSWGGGVARARTKARQLHDLAAAGRLGALSGLLVFYLHSGSSGVFHAVWVPWQVAERVSTGAWYADDLTAIGAVECTWPRNGDPDFLTAALSMSLPSTASTNEASA